MKKAFTVTAKLIKDADMRVFEKLKQRLVGERVVRVGFPAGPLEPGGTPVALVAAVHEFGSPERGIPERSFLRAGIRENSEKYVRLNRVNLVKMVRGQMTSETALGQLGEMAKGDVQRYIRQGEFEPLAQETVDRKKSSKPLIDTGQMIQSLTHELGEGE